MVYLLTPMPGYLEHFCSHESWTTHECPMAREGSSQASQSFSIPPLQFRDAFSLPMKTFCYNISLDVGIIYLTLLLDFIAFLIILIILSLREFKTVLKPSFSSVLFNALNIFTTCSLKWYVWALLTFKINVIFWA